MWTKDDSPYLVTGDVTISSGRSLTIKEGVKVIFLANSDSTEGGEQKYDSELLVEGSISVLGTAAEPVTFTSSETAPTKGDWGGIRHQQTGVFEYVVLEYSGYGIYAQNADITVKNSKIRYSGGYGLRGYGDYKKATIEDTEFEGIEGMDSRGIYFWGWNGGEVVFRRCKITNSNYSNLQINERPAVLEDNEFSNNERINVQLYDPKGDVTVKNNKFSGNKYGQIYLRSPNQDNLTFLVEGNSIKGPGDNSGYMEGIIINGLNREVEVLIKNNTLENRYDGISVGGNYNNTPTITGNTIKGTHQQSTGINVSGKIKSTIENNTIENKQYGIRVQYSDANGDGSSVIKGNVIKGNSGYGIRVESYAKPVISLNDIENNSGYFVDNQTAYTVDARNNWWGATLKAVIESGDNPRALDKFYDQYDDSTKGLINYAGWLSATATDPNNPPTLVAQMSGQLGLVDSSGDAAATYQAGDKVYVKLTDSDRNAASGTAETIDVKVTSDTEDTGDPFTASAVTADSGNTGDGTLAVLKTSYDTKTEDWTLMMINADTKTFKVTGSVSGVQNKQLSMRKKVNDWEGTDLTEVTYTSDGERLL